MAEDKVVYQDAEQQISQDEKITFQGIVLNHLNKILELSREEWRGGYISTSARGIEVYNPDTRARYWNAVNSLSDLLYPHYDETMKKAEKDLEEEEKKLFLRWHKRNEQGIPIPIFGEGFEEKFKDMKIILKRRLFRSLCEFLKRKDYFKGIVMEDIL